MVFQQSWRSSQRCWALVGCFAFTLQSNSSQTISVGFRLSDCGGQVISITLFHGQIALTKPRRVFGAIVLLKNKWWSHQAQSRWYGMSLQNVPLILNKSPKCHPQIRSPFLGPTKTWWVEPKIANLGSSDQCSDFHCTNVHSLCFLDQAFLFLLLFFLSSGFFAFNHEGLIHTVSSQLLMLWYFLP